MSEEYDVKPLDPDIWLPHVWFFLRTTAHSYPEYPNQVTKRKYYDFIQNLPLFFPHEKVSNLFSHMLDKFPITPYLDNRDSFFYWIHFMENRMNRLLGKEEETHFQHMDNYYREYEPKVLVVSRRFHIQKKYIVSVVIFVMLAFIAVSYMR
jgi:hypothetical protein